MMFRFGRLIFVDWLTGPRVPVPSGCLRCWGFSFVVVVVVVVVVDDGIGQ